MNTIHYSDRTFRSLHLPKIKLIANSCMFTYMFKQIPIQVIS